MAGGRTPLDYCPGCKRDLPAKAFALRSWTGKPGGDKSERAGEMDAVVCQECRDEGRGPVEDKLLRIDPKWRKVIKDICSGEFKHLTSVAKANGMSKGHLLSVLNDGNRRPSALEIRAAFQECLEMEGLDLYSIARMMRLCLHATRAHWNSTSGQFDHYPDYSARIAAIRHLTKLHDAEPKENKSGFQANVTQVNIYTNLDGKHEKAKGDGGAYTIDVQSEPEAGVQEPAW